MKMTSELKILNLGCGLSKFEGMINVDSDSEVKPDIIHDITNIPLPFETSTISTVYLLHTIEHLTEEKQINVLMDIRRVLVPKGKVVISYPEFIHVAQNYIDNKNGERDFWKATLYGRQLSPTDYHVALMDTRYFTQFLSALKFKVLVTRPEKNEVFNTLVIAEKSDEVLTREQVIKEDIFGEN